MKPKLLKRTGLNKSSTKNSFITGRMVVQRNLIVWHFKGQQTWSEFGVYDDRWRGDQSGCATGASRDMHCRHRALNIVCRTTLQLDHSAPDSTPGGASAERRLQRKAP